MNNPTPTATAQDAPAVRGGASARAGAQSTEVRLDRLFRRSLPPQPEHPLRALIAAYREAIASGGSHG